MTDFLEWALILINLPKKNCLKKDSNEENKL